MMLTAGLGTRLRPVTDRYAKPAVPFLGVPLVHYPLALMREMGVTSLVLNTHYKAEQIEKIANELSTTHFQVTTSHEPGDAPLGSGGGIAHAREHLSGDFLISNGDEVILPRRRGVMKDFLSAHQRDGSLATILVMRHPLVGTQFGGVWADIHGKVHGFGKEASAYPGCVGYHYIGLLLLNERVFRYLPEKGESNILYDGLTQAIAAGEQVKVIVDSFTWFETGNPSDFLDATGDALKLAHSGSGIDAQILRAIVDPYWKERFTLETVGEALLLKSTSGTVSGNARVEGFAVVDEGAEIASGSTLKNVVVMPRAIARGDLINKIILPE